MAIRRVLCRVRLLFNNDFSVVSKYSTVVNSVSINKSVRIQTVRHFRTNFPSGLVLSSNNKDNLKPSSSSSSSDSDLTDTDSDSEDDRYPEEHLDVIKIYKRCQKDHLKIIKIIRK